MNKKYVSLLVAIPVLVLGFAFVAPAIADTTTAPTTSQSGGSWVGHRMPGVRGTVSAINGTTLTVTSKNGTTYTVDASNATVTKSGATSSVSAIAVGDMIAVQGTVSGTSVTATTIRDGLMMRRSGVFGTVASVSGNTLTVTSTNRKTSVVTTYTVDATNATVTKSGVASSVSAIAVGDTVMIQGTVSGTNVTATKIFDGKMTGGKGTFNHKRGIFGTVSVVNGTTLTVTSTNRRTSVVTTYTVDASNATVTENGTTSSVANINVGNKVMIQGTVTGTNVVATKIRDGMSTKSN